MPTTYQFAVKRFMTRNGLTSTEVAKRMGVSRTVVLRMLETPIIPADSQWPALLDALGLELVLRFKPPESEKATES